MNVDVTSITTPLSSFLFRTTVEVDDTLDVGNEVTTHIHQLPLSQKMIYLGCQKQSIPPERYREDFVEIKIQPFLTLAYTG